MVEKERVYINRRFPNVKQGNILYEKILTKQPDGSSCGLYAAAFAETINSGGNPSEISYSTNVIVMRKHLMEIIRTGQVSPFPRR